MVQPRLDDRHPYQFYVVQVPEQGRGAQAVQPKLRVARGFHLDTGTVFEVEHLDGVVRQDHGVGCPESLRDPFVQAEGLFDQDLRVVRSIHRFLDPFDVEVRGLFHLS